MRKLLKSSAAFVLAGVMALSSTGFSVLAASNVNVEVSTSSSIQVNTASNNTAQPEIATISALNIANDVTWESRAFGQSTDLDFVSTILPEKVGTNNSTKKTISVKDSEGNVTEKEAIVIESRGGKIANAHDGLTFYYTTLPVDSNFVLEAKVFLNQFGPENGSTPSKQEAVGLMVRDTIAPARQDPRLEGYEELPACSNDVVTMLQANTKSLTTPINVTTYQRNGVFSQRGNANVSYSSKKFTTLLERGNGTSVVEDLTPADGESYNESDFFTLKLEKTDEGFTTTYISADGSTTATGSANDPGRLTVLDNENMYVGLFASRNAKVTYTDISLTVTDGNCPEPTFAASGFAAELSNYSNTYTDSSDYNLVIRSNYTGTLTVTQDSAIIYSELPITAGEDLSIHATLSNPTTAFNVALTSDNGSANTNFTVTMVDEKYTNRDLYVSADGTSDAEGTLESPLDITTAMNYVSDGYTVYAIEGENAYDALNIAYTMSGSKDAMKTLKPYNNGNIVFRGNSYLYASYWILDNIKITGSNSAGMRVYGTGNIITNCEFYENLDTGLQLGRGSTSSRELWPRDNTISYCYSHHNVDASGINADGFAAKLGVGTGNVFEYCEAANNNDDGWDLYNKLGDIKNDPVTIRNCIAYGNQNNGFKLGGEGYDVDHVIEYCLAYDNGLDGFTCNFNTGTLTVTNNTSVDNARYNYIFRYNPYMVQSEAGVFRNNISYRTSSDAETYDDYIYSTDLACNYFYYGSNASIANSDFVSTIMPSGQFARNTDGSFNYAGYMQPTATSILTSGANSTFVGAISPVATVNDTPVVEKPTVNTPETGKVTVSLNKTSLTFDTIGATKKLTPTITCTNGMTQPASVWSSSNKAVAKVSSNGTITAVGNGTATITLKVGTASASCKVTVSQKSTSVSINLKGVKISGKTLSVKKGKSYSLKASVLPTTTASSNAKITWKSSNKKIATVTNAGKVKIKGTGKVKITATTADGKKATVTFKATKNNVKVKKLTITGSKKMKVKTKQTLNVTVSPITATNAKVTWKSSNKKIATVNSKGVVKAKKAGKVKITAIAKDGSKKKVTFTIKVTKK